MRSSGVSHGWFKSKKTISLHRKLPATVHLKGGSIGVKTNAHDPRNKAAAENLHDTLEAELLKYNNQFTVDDTSPTTSVSCNITDLLIPGTKVVYRTESQRVKVGSKWQMQQQKRAYQEVTGSINVAYQVKDSKSGHILDADNLQGKYNQEFDAGGNKTDGSQSLTKTVTGVLSQNPFKRKQNNADEKQNETPPTPAELQALLLKKVVAQVAARLTNTDETIEVHLARGDALDEYNDLAEKGLWERYLEALETHKPLDTKEDDAYRLYNIGVGYEARAYLAESNKAAKRFLDEAAINYGKAVNVDEHEKEFLDAQNRIATAQAHYAKLGASSPAPAHDPSKSDATSVSENAPSTRSDVLTNAKVIEFVKEGLDEQNVIEIIRTASKVDFDMTPDAQLDLVKSGVKGKVLMAMRSRAHPPTKSASAAAGRTRNRENSAMRLNLLKIWLLLAVLSASPALQAQTCGAASDLMNRALERVRAHNTNQELADSLELLKLAVQQCSELGDAWYYRSLFETRLHLDQIAEHSLKQARLADSDALQKKLDPFTLSTPVDGTSVSLASKVRQKWALVVGINEFKSQNIKPLSVATSDADSFAELLRDPAVGRFPKDHVRVLEDSQATLVDLRKSLNWLAESAKADDLVVIFISTHGSAREADTANVNYVLAYDTDVSTRDDLYATALPMVEVSNVIRSRVRALRAVVFLDTCHSGAASENLRDASVSSNTLDQIREGFGRAIISSSTANQASQESKALGHGYFTYHLLRALKQEKGMVPLRQVFSYLQAKVPDQVMVEKHAKQTPVIAMSDRGADIVIGVESGG